MTTTRVLLRIGADFVPPNYAREVRYMRFGLCTLEVGQELLQQLRSHPGVLGLSLPRERRVVHVPPQRAE